MRKKVKVKRGTWWQFVIVAFSSFGGVILAMVCMFMAILETDVRFLAAAALLFIGAAIGAQFGKAMIEDEPTESQR